MQTRLSKDEALAIARRATADDPLCQELNLAAIEQKSGVAVWIVSSATVGLVLEVSIDDATAEVLEVRRLGVR